MARFSAQAPNGVAVLELERLVRTAVFKSANQVVGYLLQKAADQIDAAYQRKPGQRRKGREPLLVSCIFGTFLIQRDYYYNQARKEGHYPADAALGLEGGHTPALARLACLEGADQASYQQAEEHLRETGGRHVLGGTRGRKRPGVTLRPFEPTVAPVLERTPQRSHRSQ